MASASAALPDLVSVPPTNPLLQADVAPGGEQRLLLRFDSYLQNRLAKPGEPATGPLEVAFRIVDGGVPEQHPRDDRLDGAVRQRIDRNGDGVFEEDRALPGVALPGEQTGPRAIFEDKEDSNRDAHNHWHLQRAAEYDLAHLDGRGAVSTSKKVGFCLMDSLPDPGVPWASAVYGPAPRIGNECRRAAPGGGEIRMGITPGWRDLYTRNLAHQWVDVSDVQPGSYLLRSRIDPDDVIEEVDEVNGFAGRPVAIPGYVARPRVAARSVVLAGAPVLPSSGVLAPPRYRIERPPAHGTVDKPVGVWFDDPVVRYTPADPAAPVADDLTYVVRAADSAFPRTPAAATVAFAEGAAVAIGGAPAELVSGTTVQLTAAGPAGEALTWSASAGSVTPDGRFTAPMVAGETVTVRATAPGGATDAVAVRIVAPPAPVPAPLPPEAVGGDPATAPRRGLVTAPPVLPARAVVKATARKSGRTVIVSVLPGRSQRVRMVLRRGGRTVAACAVRATAGRTVTCRLRRPSTGRGALRVVVVAGKLSRPVPIRTGHVH